MGTCNRLHRWLFLVGLLSLSSVLLPAATAEAQEEGLERGSQLVTGFTGPFFLLSDEADNGENQANIEFESDWAFGGSYQYFFTPNLSGEASVTFATGDGEIGDDLEDGDDQADDENGENGENEGGETEGISGDALYFTGGIVYNFRPEGRFMPYVTAGAGLVRINLDGSNESRPAGIFGGGLMLTVSQSLLVRVDARDHLYTLDQGGGSTTRNDLSLTGGVSVRF